jgi:hypothetical protein
LIGSKLCRIPAISSQVIIEQCLLKPKDPAPDVTYCINGAELYEPDLQMKENYTIPLENVNNSEAKDYIFYDCL